MVQIGCNRLPLQVRQDYGCLEGKKEDHRPKASPLTQYVGQRSQSDATVLLEANKVVEENQDPPHQASHNLRVQDQRNFE